MADEPQILRLFKISDWIFSILINQLLSTNGGTLVKENCLEEGSVYWMVINTNIIFLLDDISYMYIRISRYQYWT